MAKSDSGTPKPIASATSGVSATRGTGDSHDHGHTHRHAVGAKLELAADVALTFERVYLTRWIAMGAPTAIDRAGAGAANPLPRANRKLAGMVV